MTEIADDEFSNIEFVFPDHNRLLGAFSYLNMGRVCHSVPIFEYTWEERLRFEQAAHPRSGKHTPFASQGEATWAVLRRGCDSPIGDTYRDSECCVCARCKLVYWNTVVPEHFYVYTPELNVPDPVRPPAPKRAFEPDDCESGIEDTQCTEELGKYLQDEIMS